MGRGATSIADVATADALRRSRQNDACVRRLAVAARDLAGVP